MSLELSRSSLRNRASFIATALVAVVLLAAAALYAWTPATFPRNYFSSAAREPYQELAESMLAGQLSLLRQPAPELASLANPYDPAENAPYRVADLSYYRGHYYLYHGAPAALLIFAPVKLIFGVYPSEAAVVVICCSIGLAAGLWLLLALRRNFYPRSSLLLLLACALALTLANGYYVVIRGVIANHVAIAAAYAFAMIALAAAFQAVLARRPEWWLLLASTGLGLAIASRPNYIVPAGLLIAAGLVVLRSSPWRWRLAAASLLPLGVIIAGILAYNAARFGHPLEFGARYMLGGWDQSHLAPAGFAHSSLNAWHYLFAPAQLSPYFPFVTATDELAIGVLRYVPWLWLAPLALWLIASRSCPSPVRGLALAAFILGVGNLATLILLPSGNPQAILTSANSRYVFDFLPELVLAVAVGIIAASEHVPRRLLMPVALLFAVTSALIGLSLDFQAFPAQSYQRLAWWLNHPAAWGERLAGLRYGPLELEVEFPRGHDGQTDPLVATGVTGMSDLVFVRYTSETTVSFGLVSDGIEGPVSSRIEVKYGTPHRLVLQVGSLYPRIGHPGWKKVGMAASATLQRRIRIQLDGQKVLDDVARFHPSTAREVNVGSRGASQADCSPRFQGKISLVKRLPIEPSTETERLPINGSIHLNVVFPKGASGRTEPLIVTGVPRAGDFLFVHYLDGEHLQIGLDHWGHRGLLSAVLPIAFDRVHQLEAQFGSLVPDAYPATSTPAARAALAAQKRQVRVVLNGTTILSADFPTYDSSPYDVTIGRNTIGGSTCSYAFTGTLTETAGASHQP